MPARILVADDHRIIRDGIRSLVRGTNDMVVVGEAGDGRTAVELARKLKVNSEAELTLFALKEGLITLDAGERP